MTPCAPCVPAGLPPVTPEWFEARKAQLALASGQAAQEIVPAGMVKVCRTQRALRAFPVCVHEQVPLSLHSSRTACSQPSPAGLTWDRSITGGAQALHQCDRVPAFSSAHTTMLPQMCYYEHLDAVLTSCRFGTIPSQERYSERSRHTKYAHFTPACCPISSHSARLFQSHQLQQSSSLRFQILCQLVCTSRYAHSQK